MQLAVSQQRKEHHLHRVPVLVLMPHSRCNCRCIMCDIWKANRRGQSLTQELVLRLQSELRMLGVEEVLLSGGEALMHPQLWSLCGILKTVAARITLLSTGLLLGRHARDISRWCDEVIVSLDGPAAIHDAVRGVPGAFDGLAQGIKALRTAKPGFPVSARCVVQKQNFRALSDIVAAARSIGLDRISFLAADISSQAFNRQTGWPDERSGEVCLDREESLQFQDLMEAFIAAHRSDTDSGFIAEDPDRLRRLPQYYRAVHGQSPFPVTRCAAPWISTVIESDGTVRPCFFHDAIGNIHDDTLPAILNSKTAVAFRQQLDVTADPICRRCVCTLNP